MIGSQKTRQSQTGREQVTTSCSANPVVCRLTASVVRSSWPSSPNSDARHVLGRRMGGFSFERARELELVVTIPSPWIGLELLDHARQCCAQATLGAPAELLAGSRDVELEMVIGDVDHPGLDERLLSGHVLLEPRTRF